jgi:hypothetical protein
VRVLVLLNAASRRLLDLRFTDGIQTTLDLYTRKTAMRHSRARRIPNTGMSTTLNGPIDIQRQSIQDRKVPLMVCEGARQSPNGNSWCMTLYT